jgi:hypothetical protein
MYRELKDLTPENRKVTRVDLDGTGSPDGIVGKTSLPSALAQS